MPPWRRRRRTHGPALESGPRVHSNPSQLGLVQPRLLYVGATPNADRAPSLLRGRHAGALGLPLPDALARLVEIGGRQLGSKVVLKLQGAGTVRLVRRVVFNGEGHPDIGLDGIARAAFTGRVETGEVVHRVCLPLLRRLHIPLYRFRKICRDANAVLELITESGLRVLQPLLGGETP